MRKRRSIKNKNSKEYKTLNQRIHSECGKAKEKWIEEQCNELEDLEKKNIQLIYKKMSKRTCRTANTALKTKGEVVMEE